MKPINRRTAIELTAAGVGALAFASGAPEAELSFGAEFPTLDSLATGKWWWKGLGPAPGRYTVKAGRNQPESIVAQGVEIH
jgi:hypothetical protein